MLCHVSSFCHCYISLFFLVIMSHSLRVWLRFGPFCMLGVKVSDIKNIWVGFIFLCYGICINSYIK